MVFQQNGLQKQNGILHLWTFKTPNLKSLGIYCFINYYSFINFIYEKLIKIYKYLGILIVQRCKINVRFTPFLI